MLEVDLSPGEMIVAANVGCMRRINAIRKARSEPHGTPKDMWQADIEACAAELAVSKATGLRWPMAISPDLSGDVGGLEVRWTKWPNGRLLMHKKDDDDAYYVLVRGAMPNMKIIGYKLGRDCKNDEWWEQGDGRPAFFVGEQHLTIVYSEEDFHSITGRD